MKRVVILLAGLAAMALLPVAATATHRPGHGQAKSLTLRAKPNPVVFGRLTVLSGRLVGAKNAGKTVQLRADPYPFDNFGTVATDVTNSKGEYVFAQAPPVNTLYRTRESGVQSPIIAVLVRIRTSLRLSDYTPKRGQRVRFAGRACPTHDGRRVAIQRRTRTGRWWTIGRTRTRDALRCSIFSKRIRLYRDGVYRAVVAPHTDHWRGISRRRRTDVHL